MGDFPYQSWVSTPNQGYVEAFDQAKEIDSLKLKIEELTQQIEYEREDSRQTMAILAAENSGLLKCIYEMTKPAPVAPNPDHVSVWNAISK